MLLSDPQRIKFSFLSILSLIVIFQIQTALANPTGGSVASGSVTIQSGPGSVVINQASSAAVINWQSFSINSGETTRFFQPGAQSAALNRVLGGGASVLNGSLSANGQVYLINQNGILVGPGGVVNAAGGFTASTRDISDENFLNGKDSFVGHSKAGVKNLGEITSLLGNVVLIGKTVNNQGQVTAKHGAAELIAGDDVLLGQRDGIGNTIQVNPSPLAKRDSKRIGVNNTGQITAAEAQLKAANGNVYALAINNGGVIRSTSVSHQGGHIWLTSDSGAIVNTGILNASAVKSGGTGGSVVIKNAGTVSDTGSILAKGGTGGTGGYVDLSGKKLNFTGAVDLTAQNGKTGNFLIDPATLNVVTGGTGTVVSGQNDGVSTTISPTTVDSALGSANLTLNANTNITISNAISWTNGNTLTLSTNTMGSTISINAPITGTNGGLTIITSGVTDTITPSSTGAISVNAFILQKGYWTQNALGGTLAGFSSPSNFLLEGNSNFLRFQNGNGTSGNPYLVSDVYGLQGIGSPSNNLLGSSSTPLYYQQTANISAGFTSTWNSSVGFTAIGLQPDQFYGTYNGNGFTINGLTIIQGGSYPSLGIFNYVGSGTFTNLGLVGTNIQGGSNVGGLVGTGAITMSNCYSTGAVTGSGADVGGLVGYLVSGSMNNCYNTGNVSGVSPDSLAGLVGLNFGTITNCYNTGTISTTSTSSEIGGLIGENDGTVTKCFSTGMVTGSNDIGGLVGNNQASITLSYATGNASGGSSVGGLVGQTGSGSNIMNCYATGSASATAGLGGGLIGYNEGGLVATSYSTGAVGGGGGQLGGFIGEDSSGTINDCYFSTDGSGQSLGVSVLSGSTIQYGGSSASNVTGLTLAQMKVQSNFDSAWSFALGSGTWGIDGYSSSGQINGGRPFLQNQFTAVASVVPTAQSTTYNRTNIGTGFSTTGYSFTGTVPQTANPVLTVTGSNVNVGTTDTISISSASPAAGYAIEVPPTTALESFTAKPITVTAGSVSSVAYGNTPAFSNNGQSQVIAGDTLGGTATYSTTDALSAAGYLNAGTFSYIPSISGYNSNYSITSYVSGPFTINPKVITVSGNSISSVVYGNTPAFSNNGQSQVFSGDTLGGTATYSNTDAMSPAGYLNAGTYSYTPNITGANSNYALSFSPTGFSITSAPITAVSAGSVSSVNYGNTPAFNNNGQSQVFSGDTLGGTVTYPTSDGISPAGYLDAGNNTYSPSISGYNPNYTILGYYSAPFTINPAPITISANTITTVSYGNTPAFTNNGQSQVFSGDTLGGTTTYSNTDGTSPAGYLNAGTYSYTPSISGYNGNYLISSYNPANFTINPAAITVSANATSTTYGSTPVYSHNGESQVFSGDTLGGTATYSSTDSTSPAGYLNAGTYSYTPSISGYNSNYTISNYNSAALVISQKAITVSGTSIPSTTYGSNPAFQNDGQSQVYSGDTLGGTATYSNTGTVSPAGYIDVGSFNYTPSITGYNSNYTITGYNSGPFTVVPLSIIVSATSGVTSTYGTNPVFSHNGESQVLAGDTLGGTATYSNTDALSPAGFPNAGTYNYTPSITGYNPDYAISSYNAAAFTINPLAITASARPVTATYGSTPAFSDNGNSQVLTGDSLGGTVTYSNTDALSAAGYLNAGTYRYTPTFTGANPNYVVSGASAPFTINPALLTISVDPGQSVVYGTATKVGNAGFTFTQSGLATGDASPVSLGGYLLGQTVSGGPYSITATTTDASNYSLVLNPANFNVTPKPITVSAIDLTTAPLTYGSTVPFANDGAVGQLVGTDVLGGITTYSTADGLSPAGFLSTGTYSYMPSVTGANPNYALTFKAANFTINAKTITVMANSGQGVVYGTDSTTGNAGFTYTASGLLGGDSLAGTLGGYSSTQTVAGGPYSITQGTLGNANYSISSFVPSTFQVNPATLSYVADPATGIFGLPFPQFTGTVSGFVNGDTQSNSTSGNILFQTTALATSPQGLYGINGSGLRADNYTFVQAPGNSKAFLLTEPAEIVTFEVTSDTSNGSNSNQTGTGGQTGDLNTFGGDYLMGTRRERDRNSNSQNGASSVSVSVDAVISNTVVDQSGQPAKGFSIRGGYSGFDRGSSSVPFFVAERLQRSLSRDVRALLADSNKSRPAGSGQGRQEVAKTTINVKLEVINDKNGKATKNFFVLPGGAFGMGSKDLPPLIQQRIMNQLDDDVRSVLSKAH